MAIWYIIWFLVVAAIILFAYSLCYSAKKADEESERFFREESKDGN